MADPKIEIWSKDISNVNGRLPGDPQHLYIVYTDVDGNKSILRGGPQSEDSGEVLANGSFGKVVVKDEAYTDASKDWYDPSNPKPGQDPHTLVSTYAGADATALYEQMRALVPGLNSQPTVYSPFNDNSNTVVAYLAQAVGLEDLLSNVSRFVLPLLGTIWAPGSDGVFLDYSDDFMEFSSIPILEQSVLDFDDAEDAAVPPPRRDPLTLDLDGDGIETLGITAGAYFDHDGNGFAEQTGWVGADDGLLVWDRNADGGINDGGELFGDQTRLQDGTLAANGFQALAEWDTNADGKIDSNDTVWANIKVWQDADGDGYSSASEIKNLSDFGITGINLSYTPVSTSDGQGNTQVQSGSFTKADGTTGAMGGFEFSRDTLYTVQEEYLAVSADIAALPNLRGYGNVHDLQQAIVRDTTGTLKTLVESFVAETNPGTRNALLEEILFTWTGADTIDPASRGGSFDARKLAALEKFYD